MRGGGRWGTAARTGGPRHTPSQARADALPCACVTHLSVLAVTALSFAPSGVAAATAAAAAVAAWACTALRLRAVNIRDQRLHQRGVEVDAAGLDQHGLGVLIDALRPL